MTAFFAPRMDDTSRSQASVIGATSLSPTMTNVGAVTSSSRCAAGGMSFVVGACVRPDEDELRRALRMVEREIERNAAPDRASDQVRRLEVQAIHQPEQVTVWAPFRG